LKYTDRMDPEKYIVSGTVRSYNPNNPVTLLLMQGNEVKHTTIIAAEAGNGRHEQSFTFKYVEPGTYTLVITKAAHLKFTVHNVVVGEEDLDLTQDGREAVRLISMTCGDINGDGQINSGDMLILLSNYLQLGEKILADLNGDGQVNSSDLLILLGNYLSISL